MGRFFTSSIFILIFVMIDLYTFYGMKSIIGQGKSSRIFPWVYGVVSLIGYISLFNLLWSMQSGPFGTRTPMVNLMIGLVFTLFVSKFVFSAFMGIQDLGRFIAGIFNYSRAQISDTYAPDQFFPSRRKFLTTATTMIAAIPFFTMLYGITRGKYRYTVERISLAFGNLPKAFDGLKVVQISDVHAGSFDSPERVKEGIDMINALDPDIVCFTGDLVNKEKDEIDPYIEIFAGIKAKIGKYAIYGNHDYYGTFTDENAYFKAFGEKFKAMGFDILANENRQIERDGTKIHIVGVENWGAGRWFPKRGNLDLATQGVPSEDFSILLSHDPTHWDEKVLADDVPMDLTLSGHTHGFQFGLKVPGYSWSPAKYRYPRWMGIYKEKDRYLYVNRGFGFLGFPGRIGMWPEITCIELKTA